MAQAGGRLWFQLYMWPDREMSRQLVQRARLVGFEALIVTVDTATGPNREYNRRNVFDLATHPGWLLRVMGRYLLNSGMPTLENLPDALRQSLTASVKTRRSLPLADSLTWDDLRELRRMWDGPLMVKGILDADDARLAVDCGADGLIVSNHGGRNLDSTIAPIDALPEVADAVGHRAHVFMDSGVRRGSDIAKALALGARAVFAGRAPLWGVAVAGEQGAARAISILRDELDRVMAYLGCPTPGARSSSLIRSDRHFFTPPSRPLHS